jgi:23S rRNA (adenine2503-C2)-methyltransferase
MSQRPNDTQQPLFGMSAPELEQLAESLGEKSFRGRQIARWLYQRNAESIAEMSDLPAQFREQLSAVSTLYRAQIITTDQAPDGTAKYLLQMADSQRLEAVLLPYKDRVAVCVSTQIGCPAGCLFCATGKGGFVRNLSAGEIVDEVLTLQKTTPRKITHVVYMGMGEPLLNYDNVIKSLRLLNDEVGISMRRISISTAGITPAIRRLATEKLQATLALSLHAPNDSLRQQLMPMAGKYPLADLLKACREYADQTHRRITFEYLLLKGVNDSPEMAQTLVSLLKGLLCSVNLIPYNAVEELPFSRPTPARAKAFREILEKAGLAVTQRMERGATVSGACGQLRRRS